MSETKPKAKPRTWGFRFAFTDGIILLASAGAAFGLWRLGSPLWWMLFIVVAHFFLFCNVFRVVRRREFIWAGLFLLNVGTWTWWDNLTWAHVLWCQLPITFILIAAELRTPRYHGVCANWLNPRLNNYLEDRIP